MERWAYVYTPLPFLFFGFLFHFMGSLVGFPDFSDLCNARDISHKVLLRIFPICCLSGWTRIREWRQVVPKKPQACVHPMLTVFFFFELMTLAGDREPQLGPLQQSIANMILSQTLSLSHNSGFCNFGDGDVSHIVDRSTNHEFH